MSISNLALKRENDFLRKERQRAVLLIRVLRTTWLGRLALRRAAKRVERELLAAQETP